LDDGFIENLGRVLRVATVNILSHQQLYHLDKAVECVLALGCVILGCTVDLQDFGENSVKSFKETHTEVTFTKHNILLHIFTEELKSFQYFLSLVLWLLYVYVFFLEQFVFPEMFSIVEPQSLARISLNK
jgi:hypothetical protein